MRKFDTNIGPLDHALAALACILAVYSIGMSLGNAMLATFFSIAVVVTAFSGYAIARSARKTRLVNYDSYFWALGGVATTALVNQLNDMLPGGGFPSALIAAAVLCWVLVVGNFFAWRDQTLLFLTLPCIALFGLVGTFDTFPAATGLFFVFMVTIAFLYSRVHQRAMIDRAMLAGASEPELLRRGAWKWMAGPEWALASALAIILFSFIGGPLLQNSLQDVAGQVQVAMPQTQQRNAASQSQEPADVRIGTGAIPLTTQTVIKVKIDQPRYLRLNTFSTYTGTGWRATPVSIPADSPLKIRKPSPSDVGPHDGTLIWPGLPGPPQEVIKNPRTISFEFKHANNDFQTIMAPGPVVEVMADPSQLNVLPQGWVSLEKPLQTNDRLQVYAEVPNQPEEDAKAVLPKSLTFAKSILLNRAKIPAKVRDLAYRVTEGAKTDLEKAEAIKKAIEGRVEYNTLAPRTPRDVDPVEYFLFESHEGYCDLFASSMALMARSVGLPTRYTIGYIINNPERDSEGFFTVEARDYHAWCEIYFQDAGWVVFDPTEGAPSFDGGERGSAGNTLAFYRTTWFKILLGGALLIALALPVVNMIRHRTMTADAKAVRAAGEVSRLHSNFYRLIEKAVGTPKRFSQTTREYVLAVGPRLGETYQSALSMVKDFEVAMFAKDIPSRDELGRLSKAIADLKSALSRRSSNKA